MTVIVKKCFQLLPVASTMTMERFVLYSVDSLEGCWLSSIKHYSSDFDNAGWNNTFHSNNWRQMLTFKWAASFASIYSNWSCNHTNGCYLHFLSILQYLQYLQYLQCNNICQLCSLEHRAVASDPVAIVDWIVNQTLVVGKSLVLNSSQLTSNLRWF